MDGNQTNNNVAENTDQNGNSGVNNTQQTQQQQTTQQNQTTGNGGSNTNDEKTFTQEQVNRMMSNEKKQGKEAAFRDLGIDPKDTATINMLKAFLAAQKTPEQQNAEQLQAQQIKNAELEHKALVAEAKAEALMMGADPQFVDDIITLAVSKVTDSNDIKSVLTEMKTKYTVWFGGQQGGAQGQNNQGNQNQQQNRQNNQQNQTGQNGTGSAISNQSGSGDGKPKSIGAQLAAQRKNFGGQKKTSYWS